MQTETVFQTLQKENATTKLTKYLSIKLAFMISSPLKISDVRGAVLDLNDLLCIQLLGDTLRGFGSDEIKHNLLAIAHVPEEFVL